MKFLMVGGQFNDVGGKPSGYIFKLFNALLVMNPKGKLINGGLFNDLRDKLDDPNFLNDYNVVFWFANVPNDKPKIVYLIKEFHQRIMLITSKRNNNEYSYLELIGRALKTKSNLLVNFDQSLSSITASIIDPLGNIFCQSDNIDHVAAALYKRVFELMKFTRVASVQFSEEGPEIPDQPEFFEIARGYGQQFHDLIHAQDTTRFLGNVSFRCEAGFPSFRGEQGICYVSKRNIDKRDLNKTGFVAVKTRRYQVGYYGPNKPSVDTPIQLKLYEYYKDILYMVHSHVYIWTAPFTKTVIPCGALEEFFEIIQEYPNRNSSNFCINLKGHGSIVLAKDLDYLKKVQYAERKIPEWDRHE